MARCKKCKKFMSPNGNTALRNHFELHCVMIKSAQVEGQAQMSNQEGVFAYDLERTREQMAQFVIQQSLPFNHFDNERLTRLIQTNLQPRYTHVSRTTLRRDCLKMWKMAKKDLIEQFSNLQNCVNLTSDCWSTPHGSPESYICVTAHWVVPDTWQMMKRTIAFEMLDYPHTGRNIFRVLNKVIKTYKLETKLFSISFDNASNNTNAIRHLKLAYNPVCEGIFFHSRCVAHIINLCVQDGLKVIEDIIIDFRQMLSDIFSSKSRHIEYRKYCKEAGRPSLGPNWDVPTRWNSTCNMFEKAIQQKESLIAYHNHLSGKHRKIKSFSLESWFLIEKITHMLHIFKTSTTFLSGVYYPTSPLVLNQLYSMCKVLNEYSSYPSPFPEMVAPMKEKFVKYFKEMPPVITCAAALNPCVNVTGVQLLISQICFALDLYIEEANIDTRLKDKFNQDFANLFEVYVQKYGQTSTIHQSFNEQFSAGASSSSDQFHDLYNMFTSEHVKRQRGNTTSSELGRYGSTDYLSGIGVQGFKTFDMLAWWKGKEDQFPVLSAMARDVLTVQASTVASESAFSISGRVISVRRTRLTSEAVEMSICLKDYLDAAERIQHVATLEGELDYEAEIYEDEVEGGLTPGMTDDEVELDNILRSGTSSSSSSGAE